ncbi:AraC-type DNA-binding protein [Chitinophaga costaii]|uniref:AraC-type DNA-binding protein n=1 Tax=Chitinophaga costaii TaxID=1335309 RepID=A0A1C4EEA4_9BACT|nr:AraC family transcriptional regulator [Chitinophaga costaii]SCC41880.1 AraC-type DNA-binding protein [Chitinophaga costaii]
MFCTFDIYQKDAPRLRESRRQVDREGHQGMIYELGSPDGICLGYYKMQSAQAGRVLIDNTSPFLQLSYTISGSKSYALEKNARAFATFKKQEYNYVFLPEEKLHLQWEAGEPLEIFELGISPELLLRLLPEQHPFYAAFNNSLENNVPATMSENNLSLRYKNSSILYDMLNCPLDGRYKELYLRAKTTELLAIQLEEYELQLSAAKQVKAPKALKKEDIDRMHHVRDIIVQNMHSPCSLIDLAHQVGTNDAYLKKQFKEVFGTTVFGYLHVVKMGEARRMLLEGLSVSEVAYLTGYKHVAHFTRAFKKHFNIVPNQVRRF